MKALKRRGFFDKGSTLRFLRDLQGFYREPFLRWMVEGLGWRAAGEGLLDFEVIGLGLICQILRFGIWEFLRARCC